MRRAAWIAAIVAALAAGLVGAFLFLGGGGDDEPTPGVVRTDLALPNLTGPVVRGDVGSSSFRGRAVVVNFWNPYCSPCRAEARELDLAAGRLRDRPVTIIGVLFSNDAFPHDVAAARDFAREFGEPFPTIDDPDGKLAHELGIRGIPSTAIADRGGRVRFLVLGALKPGQLDRLVRRVLGT